MDHEEMRLACLKLALELGANVRDIEQVAERLYAFVTSSGAVRADDLRPGWPRPIANAYWP